jgi:hypothetical protein
MRQSLPTTSHLIASKAFWCSVFQPGHSFSLIFVVNGVRILVWSTRCGRNWSRYLTSPRKDLTLLVQFGTGQSKICCAFEASASIPDAEIWWPRKLISVQNKDVFLGEQNKLAFHSASSTSWTFLACSVTVCDHIMMSSRYAWQIFLINPWRATNMRRWCVAGVFLPPCGITVHSCSPLGVSMAVYFISSGCMRVWKNEFVMSILPKILPFAQSCRILSIHGSGWLSSTVFAFSAL